MDRYILMFEDLKLALFSVSTDADLVMELVINPACSHYLPVGIHKKEQLKKWIQDRGIPVTRDSIAKDLEKSGISPFKLMLLNCGLSLTDHYWICRQNEHFLWKDINLYTNPFRASFSLDIQDEIESIVSRTNFIPSSSLKGDLKKKWIIDEDGIRRLVKGNYGISCRQSLCEALASKVHKMQGALHTPYHLIKISSGDSQIIGCECPCFTDISTEFVAAIDIVANEKKPNEQLWYEFYIAICEKHGLYIRDFMDYQILSDFLISNTDRHLNNFGIIRSTDTLKWLHAAPIFDSGNAMFYQAGYIPEGKELLKIQVTSFCDTEVKLLKCVKNRGILDLTKLPDDNFLYELLKKDVLIKDEINERLVNAYREKIQYLSDFQNGADLWDYKYQKRI